MGEALDALKKQHSEVADDVVISEALHKAKADLEFKLELEKSARDEAERNVHRMEKEMIRRNAEIERESNPWFFWNWAIWSNKVKNLKRDRDFLATELREEIARKNNCDELTSRLSAQ